MTKAEAENQAKRVETFNRLNAGRSALRNTIQKMDLPISGSCASPFTGNTRESRKITNMRIDFSATLGGEGPVTLDLDYMQISAGDFGRMLEKLLEDKMTKLNAEIDAL